MRLAVLLLALTPTVVLAQERAPCSFVVGHPTLKGTVSPEWFVVTGAATLEVSQRIIRARFFDSRLGGDLSHTVSGKVTQPADADGKPSRVNVILRTMNTDSGDDTLTGTYLVTKDVQGGGGVYRILVAQNPTSFIGIHCHARGAN